MTTRAAGWALLYIIAALLIACAVIPVRADIAPGMKGVWSLTADARSDTAGVVKCELTVQYAAYTIPPLVMGQASSYWSASEGVSIWARSWSGTLGGSYASMSGATWRLAAPASSGQLFGEPTRTSRTVYNDGTPFALRVSLPAGWTVDMPAPKVIYDDVALDLVAVKVDGILLSVDLPELRLVDPTIDPPPRLTHYARVAFTMRRAP